MISHTENIDCMEFMARFPDKHFELAIVDPPYGIGVGKMSLGKWGSSRLAEKEWDEQPPSDAYWAELFRVSKNQIVWGGNYFGGLQPSRAFVIWDKGAGFAGRDFAECEMAWCSFDANAVIFRHDPLANGDYKGKIHPTQKPVALYKWLLSRYAKPGDKILDTHLGSGSSRIAAWDLGFDFYATELDADYFKAQEERFSKHKAQGTLFDPVELPANAPKQGVLR